jgi:hypothetical protein
MERIYGPLVFSTGTLNIDRYGKALMGRTVAIQINYSQWCSTNSRWNSDVDRPLSERFSFVAA